MRAWSVVTHCWERDANRQESASLADFDPSEFPIKFMYNGWSRLTARKYCCDVGSSED